MCGIAGIAGDPDGPGARFVVERMCDRLRHRGPDGTAVRTLGATASNAARSDATTFGVTTFGFVRLAIIDLETGDQPLRSADGTVTVMVNGEIFNFVELRAELEQRGCRFRTGSDAEVVVHLYRESGVDCLRRLNGMFAVAIHDSTSGEVHLARDRVGVKPLYYWCRDGRLAFASELPALLADPALPVELDREAIAEMLTLTHLPAPRTPLTGVSKLEPGTVLTWRAGSVRVRRWWRWPDVSTSDVPPPGEVAGTIRELLVDAVRLQLRSDVPVGLLLSGGIDSTALLWAARELGSSVPGFCVDYDEPGGDAEFALLAGRQLQAQVHRLMVDGDEAQRLLPQVVAGLSEPLGDPAVLPSLLVCRAAASQVKVLLSGTGADELWGGYGRYVLPGNDPRAVYIHDLSVLPEREVRLALGLTRGRTPVQDRLSALLSGSADTAAARMYLDGVLSLPAALLPLLDQTSMAVSLEARVPLLDHRLVELAATLPGDRRIPGGDLKGLFREALRGCVPDEILDRPKRGFNPPLAGWASGPLGTAAEQLLSAPLSVTRYLLDPGIVAGWLRPGAVSPALRALRLWTLMVLDLWCRNLFHSDADPAGSLQEMLARA